MPVIERYQSGRVKHREVYKLVIQVRKYRVHYADEPASPEPGEKRQRIISADRLPKTSNSVLTHFSAPYWVMSRQEDTWHETQDKAIREAQKIARSYIRHYKAFQTFLRIMWSARPGG